MKGVACALLAAAAAVAAAGSGPTVTTKYGVLQGRPGGIADVYSSIPYAAPPVGEGRWVSPRPAAPWSGVRQATADPVGCPQDCNLPPHTCPPVISEDCLYLNVFAPKNVTSKKPVVAFIHGGNFKQGYSGGLLYDCSSMVVSQDVVCVTLNYRLGALGALYVDGELAGNFGFQDQQMALQWVAENIAAFGGDPNNVNIFGQSAGAASVALHNVAPSSKALFHKSYMLSEPFALPLRVPGTWPSVFQAFSKYAGCTSGNASAQVSCLHGVSWQDVIAAQSDTEHDILSQWPRLLELFMPWTPTTQTPLIPHRPIDGFHQGLLADMSKPVMVTTVQNEALLFIWEAVGKPMSPEEFKVIIDVIFLGHGDAVAKKFPLPPQYDGDARNFTGHIGTLALFVCPTRYAMQGMTAPTYVGHFDHVMSFAPQVWGPNFTECDNKVCHGADLPFIFRPNASALHLQFTPEEQALAGSMQDYWGSFARGGTPLPPAAGVDSAVAWPRFNMTSQAYVHLSTPANYQEAYSYTDPCDFFDEMGYDFY